MSEPMRVLHVSPGRGRRGEPGQVLRLAGRLRDRDDVEQAIAGREGSRLLGEAASLGLETVPLPWTPALDPRAVAGLARVAGGWDLLHAHGSHALRASNLALALSGAPTRLVGRIPAGRTGIPADRIRIPADRMVEATVAAYREVLSSARRRREHARWMERAGRMRRALPAEILPAGTPSGETSPADRPT